MHRDAPGRSAAGHCQPLTQAPCGIEDLHPALIRQREAALEGRNVVRARLVLALVHDAQLPRARCPGQQRAAGAIADQRCLIRDGDRTRQNNGQRRPQRLAEEHFRYRAFTLGRSRREQHAAQRDDARRLRRGRIDTDPLPTADTTAALAAGHDERPRRQQQSPDNRDPPMPTHGVFHSAVRGRDR
jgi:hypothetical protein